MSPPPRAFQGDRMRVFIALELPDHMVAQVAVLARQLGDRISGRLMKPDTYHLTLAFLGELDEQQVRDAMAALDDAAVDRAAIPLVPDGLGKFGKPHDATLWLGISPAQELMDLAEAVRAELAARDLPFDRKAFRPHITLARRAKLPRGPLPELVFPEASQAVAVTLFKSSLTPEGARYKPLYTKTLEASLTIQRFNGE